MSDRSPSPPRMRSRSPVTSRRPLSKSKRKEALLRTRDEVIHELKYSGGRLSEYLPERGRVAARRLARIALQWEMLTSGSADFQNAYKFAEYVSSKVLTIPGRQLAEFERLVTLAIHYAHDLGKMHEFVSRTLHEAARKARSNTVVRKKAPTGARRKVLLAERDAVIDALENTDLYASKMPEKLRSVARRLATAALEWGASDVSQTRSFAESAFRAVRMPEKLDRSPGVWPTRPSSGARPRCRPSDTTMRDAAMAVRMVSGRTLSQFRSATS